MHQELRQPLIEHLSSRRPLMDLHDPGEYSYAALWRRLAYLDRLICYTSGQPQINVLVHTVDSDIYFHTKAASSVFDS
jgi:hypothetical protein